MTEKRPKIPVYSLIRWLGTISAIVLVVYLLNKQGWEQIWGAVRQIGTGRFVLAIILVVVSRLMMVSRWYILLRSSAGEATFFDALRLTFAGLFANNFLPSTVGGDVVRLAGAIQAGYDGAISAASLIVDRLVGMFGMALTLPIGLYRVFLNTSPTAAASPSVLLAAGLLPDSLREYWEKIRSRVRSLLSRVVQALSLWIRRPRTLLGSLMFTGLHMACLFGIIWLFMGGMNDPAPYWMIGGLWSLVYFVTLIPISINGLGVQEVAITFAFSTLGGVSEQSSLTLALLIRTLFILASLPGAIFLPGIMPEVKK
jgi:uncharacterized membrane protein YbhN (UPF0104 family)